MDKYKLLFFTALEFLSLLMAIIAMVNHKMDWAIYNVAMAIYFRMVTKEYDE